MPRKILIWTTSQDKNVNRIVNLLGQDSYFRVNTDLFSEYKWNFLQKKGSTEWAIGHSEGEIASCELRSVLHWRPTRPPVLNNLLERDRLFAAEESFRFLKSFLSTIDPTTFWMNHPNSLVALERNKCLQAQIANRLGFMTPNTTITNSAEQARQFIQENGGRAVLKTFGGTSLSDEGGKSLAVYTSVVGIEDFDGADEAVSICPIMLQEYVPKKIELRITVVGNKCFACSIDSQASEKTRHDWRRYDFDNVSHSSFDIPSSIKFKILEFMRISGLTFGAIDMIVTPNNEYFWIEINPSGQWQWIEVLTGLPIDQAIANALLR